MAERRSRVTQLVEHEAIQRSSVEACAGPGLAPHAPEVRPPQGATLRSREREAGRLHGGGGEVLSEDLPSAAGMVTVRTPALVFG